MAAPYARHAQLAGQRRPLWCDGGKMAIWVVATSRVSTATSRCSTRWATRPPVSARSAPARSPSSCTSLTSAVLGMALAEVFTMGIKAGIDPVDLWAAVRQGATGWVRTFARTRRPVPAGQKRPGGFRISPVAQARRAGGRVRARGVERHPARHEKIDEARGKVPAPTVTPDHAAHNPTALRPRLSKLTFVPTRAPLPPRINPEICSTPIVSRGHASKCAAQAAWPKTRQRGAFAPSAALLCRFPAQLVASRTRPLQGSAVAAAGRSEK